MLGWAFVLPGTQVKKIPYHLREMLLVQDNIQDARIIAPTYFRNEAAKLAAQFHFAPVAQPENSKIVGACFVVPWPIEQKHLSLLNFYL
jgi:hypothetical protein